MDTATKKTDKQLKEKAIDIKGKMYVPIAERVVYFNETYPNGCITTEMKSLAEDDLVVFKAVVYPEGMMGRYFTGYSQAKWGDGYINKTSAIENAETSAVGRALAFMGIGVIESIASIDEINKAQTHSGKTARAKNMTPSEIKDAVIAVISRHQVTVDELLSAGERVRQSTALSEEDKVVLLAKINATLDTLDPTK